MFVDMDRYGDHDAATENAAIHALAAVVRLKSAVELRTLWRFDSGEREQFLLSLDTMLMCAISCLEAAHTGDTEAKPVGSNPPRRRRPGVPKALGSSERA